MASDNESSNVQPLKPKRKIRKPRMRVKSKPFYYHQAKALGLSDFISSNMHLYGVGVYGED